MSSPHLQSSFTIENASLEEMSFLISLAREEGLNPGIEDSETFYATDPKGFFIGKLGNEKVGSISAVAYNDDFGFLGFYIIKPSYRRQGFGIQLWRRALRYLGNRTIGLDGILKQLDTYKKFGFTLFYQNIRFHTQGIRGSYPSSVISLREVPFEMILEYDTPIFGVKRERFLEKWINMSTAQGVAIMDQGQLIGYGVLRACINGYKIGPLFADNNDVAEELFLAMRFKANNQSLFLDAPEINASAFHLAKRYGMQQAFETARMYTNTPPKQRLEKVYGVTSFELG